MQPNNLFGEPLCPDLPLVTAIAVCYNQARFVIECLESIRAQGYPNIELIIMDDCSSAARRI